MSTALSKMKPANIMPRRFSILLLLVSFSLIFDGTAAFSIIFGGRAEPSSLRQTIVKEYHDKKIMPITGPKSQLYMVASDIGISSKENQDVSNESEDQPVNIVLLAGFESFNKELYKNAVSYLPSSMQQNVHLQVFSDSEIRTGASVGVGGSTKEDVTNPKFVHAMKNADIFIGSLIFDYEDVIAVEALLDDVSGPRLLFECATELMTYNRVGSFSMEAKEGEDANSMGPPPAIKAVLSKFSSGKAEDKLSGYLKLLKM